MKLLRNLFLTLVCFLGLSAFSSVQAVDLSITAANVKQVSGVPQQYTAGATITAGQVLYLDSASNTVKLAKADATGTSTAIGIALNGASANQPVIVLTSGQITIGATPSVGTIYVVSKATAGNISPWADLVSTNYVSILGYGLNATDLIISITNTGTKLP